MSNAADIDGRCFLCTGDVESGSVLATFWARERMQTPSRLTLQTSVDEHILLAPEQVQYVNHSCDPNVFFDTVRFELVALRSIRAGEELRSFYPSTEWQMDQPFACNCGSRGCLERIRGASELDFVSGLSPDVESLRRYRLAPHIEQLIRARSTRASGRPLVAAGG